MLHYNNAMILQPYIRTTVNITTVLKQRTKRYCNTAERELLSNVSVMYLFCLIIFLIVDGNVSYTMLIIMLFLMTPNFLNTSKTPFGATNERARGWALYVRNCVGVLPTDLHGTLLTRNRSLSVYQIWTQSAQPFSRSGTVTLRVPTCKVDPSWHFCTPPY